MNRPHDQRHRTRPKDDFGQGENGPYIRHVRVTSTTAAGSQPVEVKNLRWDVSGDDYIVSGTAYGIGGSGTTGLVEVDAELWIIWRPDRRVWELLTGTANQQILVECVVAAVDTSNHIITAGSDPDSPVPLPSGTPAVDDGIKVYDPEQTTQWIVGQKFWAVYQEAVYDDSEGSNTHGQVDWRVVPFGRTRHFQLTARKKTSQSTASIYWLDDTLTNFDSGTVNDPHGRFSGLNGAKGLATLVWDDDNHTAEWVITHLQGPADYVTATLGGTFTGSPVTATVNDYGGGHWNDGDPGANVTIGSYVYSSETIPTATKCLAVLADPDTDPPTYELAEIVGSSTSSLPDAGCGLEYVDATTLAVNPGDLIGAGLGVTVGGASGCEMEVVLGCGLYFEDDPGGSGLKGVAVNTDALAGKGLLAGSSPGDGCLEEGGGWLPGPNYCCLTVNLGCGLEFGTSDEVKVDLAALAGPGLVPSTSSGTCDTESSHTPGLYCCLTVNAGCGIEIVNDQVRVNASDIAGNGLVPTGDCAISVGEGCGIEVTAGAVAVDASQLAGDALVVSGTCTLNVFYGCGLLVDAFNRLIVDTAALAGGGLKASDSLSDCGTAGTGGTYCCLYVDTGCGLQLNGTTSAVEVNRTDLIGCGLKAGSGTCDIDVDNTALAGVGLAAGTGCTLDVDIASLAGDGLYASGDQLNVNYGCGLDVVSDELIVKNTDLAGTGIKPEGTCAVSVHLDPVYFIYDGPEGTDQGYQPAWQTLDLTCSLAKDGNDLKLTLNWTNPDGTSGTTSCSLAGDGVC